MKRGAVISTGILFLLLFGSTVVGYTQEHEQQGKSQGEQHQQGQKQHQQPARQQHQQQQASRPARPARPQPTYGGAYHGGVRPDGPTHGGVHHSGVPQHEGQVRAGFNQSRAHSWNDDHRTWAQRGGYNGYRVPEARFRMYFGSDHYFRIGGLPMLFVGGYPRFQYDGYWATFMDPWPESWPANWYDTDDVYLDYTNDGYYLYDRTRPGPGIAITLGF